MILLRILFFILLRHVLWFDLVSFQESQERQGLYLVKDELKDSSSWSSSPLLRDIHNELLAKYDCKDSTPPPTQPGVRARPGRDSHDGVSQQQETTPLFLPKLNRLHDSEVYIVRGEDTSNTGVTIPAQKKLTHQIINL